MRRRKAREHALKILYMSELRQEDIEKLITEYFHINKTPEDIKEFAEKVVKGVFKNKKILDEKISDCAENWQLERMNFIDRNILRIGAYELLFENEIPSAVSINEAIELAKKFGTEDSPGFVNGILHRIKEEVKK